MNLPLIFSVAAGLFLVSCSSKKTVAVTDTDIPKETIKQEVVLTPELMEAKALYENSCVKCHRLYDPKEYSQEDWAPILNRMQKKAHLDDVQITSISNYINSQL